MKDEKEAKDENDKVPETDERKVDRGEPITKVGNAPKMIDRDEVYVH